MKRFWFILPTSERFKRVDDVIRIYNEVQKKVPSKLLLIGDGPERANIETTCRGLGVCDNIHFLGETATRRRDPVYL